MASEEKKEGVSAPESGRAPERRPPGRRGHQITLVEDRQTLNVLMLELATMVVAIALAFSASFLTVFNLNDLLVFIFTTAVVIWFWWDYIRDRLLYPPMTPKFPYLDVLVLILISLIPFAIRQTTATYIASVLAVLMIVWALMISRIMSERKDIIDAPTMNQLRTEVVQRATVGFLLMPAAALSAFQSFFGILMITFILASVIGWNFIQRDRRQRSGSAKPPG
jgi:hypothetical protein